MDQMKTCSVACLKMPAQPVSAGVVCGVAAPYMDRVTKLKTSLHGTSHIITLNGSCQPKRRPAAGPARVDNNDAFAEGLLVKVRPRTKKPPMYKVLLLNDDFTPMEFVVYVLERVFNHAREDATDIMMQVHQTGVGTAGVYTYEIAETKVDQVMLLARQHEHPLQCTMERDN